MVRTRFAPSPTGYLHIGGVRTALFNWLFARSQGGRFLLRLDDTDRERNLEEAVRPILEGLRWLGIDWDEGLEVGGDYGPYRQSERADRYDAAVERLLASGAAYRDYATPEELEAEREEARAAGRAFVYSRRWRAESPADDERFAAEGRSAVVRLTMPREGSCRFHDLVRGDVEFEWAREQDHVIRRADGTCLYHLANVVDDQDMKISHVIRAEEHLSNTPRQIFIAEALGAEPPIHAHLPFVAEPGSRNKLSKRKIAKYLKNPDFAELHARGMTVLERLGRTADAETFNPVIVGFYEDVGFLPDAVVNYLLLLGWSLDDRTEDFTREEMVREFRLDRVSKSPASFDPKKLVAFQERRMQEVPLAARTRLVLPYLAEAGWIDDVDDPATVARVTRIVEAAGDRIKIAGDILDYADLFPAAGDLAYDEKAFEKRITKPDDAIDLLAAFRDVVGAVRPFAAEALETALKGFVESRDLAISKIIHALRVATTGKAVGFGMFETLEILGPDLVVARIDAALEKARAAKETVHGDAD
ncbi:MAG: glutamate--tRNA ligase [Gemmatimonadetes bacterium]|nr:glutamate--tRNA ligase [Gemmatimonadota bacterium]